MSRLFKRRRPPRPSVRQMPDSAFFEDTGVPAVGETSRWRPLWIVTAALVVLCMSGYFVYLNLWVVFPGEVPDKVLAAAQEANSVVPDPDVIFGHRTADGYQVLFLDASGLVWEPCVTVYLSRAGNVVKVITLYGDPRPSQRITFAAGACGMLAATTALYRNRRGISLWVRPRYDWT